MWADTILDAERRQLLGAIVWGVATLAAGAALLIALKVARGRSPLLTHFALQMALWGFAIAGVSVFRYRSLGLRDVSSATRLEQLLWFSSGLEIGLAATGFAIALTSWVVAKRLGGVGAGLAIAAHGMALAVLDMQFLAVLSR